MLARSFVRKKKSEHVRGGVVRRKPLSLMSKGEKIKELLTSIPKGENVEFSCHRREISSLMLKEFMMWLLSMVFIDEK